MPGIEQQQAVFQFGVFQLDPRTGELRKHGVKLKLQDQPLRILTLLLEHAGEVVTREDIQKRLWPDNTYVDFDNAINSATRKLRDALSDSPDNPRFIETVTRRGYRFVSPVSRPATDPNTRERSPSSQETAPLVVGPVKVPNKKRHVLWMAVSLAVVLLVAGVALLRSWMMKSDQASQDAPLAAVPLTGHSGYEAFPTFSPEGTRVAFSWEQPGKHGPNIWIKVIGSGDSVRLTTDSHKDFGPSWSPDGRYIAFLRATDSDHAAIMIIPAVGGRERQLASVTFEVPNLYQRTPPPPLLAWSADGKWLLSLEQRAPNETYSILRISVETGEKRTLTAPPKHTNGDGSLAVSPDGKTLAFTRALALFERDIYLVSLSQDAIPIREPSRLTFDGREINGLVWTADGHHLLFSSDRGGRPELWRIAASASSKPVRLTAAGDDPRNVAVSREGRHLVYSREVFDSDIWRISLNDKGRKEAQSLISSTRVESHAKYSPEGKRIAFQSNLSGHDEIWISEADGSNPLQLTAFRNARAGSPRWSPDAQKIAFDCNAAGNWDIYVISSQGGKATRVTTTEANEFRPSWSRDGKWIYFCSNRTGHGQIWKIPANGGSEVQVTRHGGYVAFESFNGEDLYYTKEHELWKMPVRGGDEVRILESLARNQFALARSGIYFLDHTESLDNSPRLKFLDLTRHAIKTVAAVPGPLADSEIAVSPNERWMLYGKTVRKSSELMIVENFH